MVISGFSCLYLGSLHPRILELKEIHRYVQIQIQIVYFSEAHIILIHETPKTGSIIGLNTKKYSITQKKCRKIQRIEYFCLEIYCTRSRGKENQRHQQFCTNKIFFPSINQYRGLQSRLKEARKTSFAFLILESPLTINIFCIAAWHGLLLNENNLQNI